jgi:hypothetical protein
MPLAAFAILAALAAPAFSQDACSAVRLALLAETQDVHFPPREQGARTGHRSACSGSAVPGASGQGCAERGPRAGPRQACLD